MNAPELLNLTAKFAVSELPVLETIWANLVQKKTPDNTASLGDLNQMIAAAVSGQSAKIYMSSSCPAAILKKHKIIIAINMFVYPSSLDLKYNLTADWGNLSDSRLVRQKRSFEIVFDDSVAEKLDWLFEGTFTPESLFRDYRGAEIRPAPEIFLLPGWVRLSRAAYVALWADGVSLGYQYTLLMEINVAPGNKISALHNTVTLRYTGSGGKDIVKKLDIEIPECATDMLESCDNGDPELTQLYPDLFDPDSSDSDKLVQIYYSTCDGSVLKIITHK